jgi:hypothetical protein
LSANERNGVDALGFIENGRRLLSSSSTGLRVWDLEDLAGQLANRSQNSDAWVIKILKQQDWMRFSDADRQTYDSDRLASLIKETSSRWFTHGRFLVAAIPSGLRVIDAQLATLRDVSLPTKPRIKEDGGISFDDETELSSGSGNTARLIHGSTDPKSYERSNNRQPGNRQLYLIDFETGKVLAEWPLPADLRKGSSASLAIQTIAGETACWVADYKSIFVFLSKDGSYRTFSVKEGTIKRLFPIENANSFMLSTKGNSGFSTLMLAHFTIGRDAQNNPVTLPEGAPVAGASVSVSTSLDFHGTELT